jgi:23S rRNA U2552 (ribose-2'-O)-methylase RlmE/FtsJ
MILFILLLILILILVFIIHCSLGFRSHYNGGYFKGEQDLYINKKEHQLTELSNFITLDVKLPHIEHVSLEVNNKIFGTESIWVIPINSYSNPLPPKLRTAFWAFYPLTHFQSLIFKKPLMLNSYHRYAIEQNAQFKPLLDEASKLLKLDLFNSPCMNLGIFHKYKQFITPKLKYLHIGAYSSDYELLKLYRQKHLSIRDKFEYININCDKLSSFNTTLLSFGTTSFFNILYFDNLCDPYTNKKIECFAFIIFSALIHFPKLINHDSLVIIRITHYNSQFLIDIITILQHVFNSVHIVRNIMHLDIYIARNIICYGFNSQKLEKILPQLNKIYEHILNNTNDDDITNSDNYINRDNYMSANNYMTPTDNNYMTPTDKDKDKDNIIPIKILKKNTETESIKILTDISLTIGNKKLEHIKKTVELMDVICNKDYIIDRDRLKIIQNSEKLKAIHILNLLGIKPNFTLLFSEKDVELFMYYDEPLSIYVNKLDITTMPDTDINTMFSTLETELFMHKAYLHRVEWKRFKKLDNLFRRTKILKSIIREKKLIHKSWQLSQAFFKMLEILHETNLCNGDIKAFHICEAPGQFIKSFQKYVNQKGNKFTYYWNAQTLKPTDTNTALDDVYGFISDPKMRDNWLYGADNTGDITSYVNILDYENHAKKEKYNVITSDCGIQFSVYELQEEEIEYINYSQFITMLLCLQKGGSCAMKVFLPLARPIALYMSHLLLEYFETVIYFKPSLNLTSSEIYLIGKGYKTIPNTIRDEILTIHKNKMNLDSILPILSTDAQYIKNIKHHYISCNKLVFNSMSCINKYLFFYYYMDDIKINGVNVEKKLIDMLHKVSKEWMHKYF